MNKYILLFFLTFIGFNLTAQVSQHFPIGFQKANVPGWIKNRSVKSLYPTNGDINLAPYAETMLTLNHAQSSNTTPADEVPVGNTFYDLQTNNSISNRLCVNDDGTISAVWVFSPDDIFGSFPPYPSRGSGYNYWDGTNWYYASGPATRQENIRTGFTNIVVTPVSELLIAHANVSTTDSSKISVSYRATKGNGPWTTTAPWGNAFDLYPKACAAGSSGTNNNVYVIFLGSGSVGPVIQGQHGPLFFSRSTDGGVTWEPKRVIDLIDSSHYHGFGHDCYSIDAKDSIVAIGFGNMFTDVGLLKSTDYGQTWTKIIIQQHPIPLYTNSVTDINNDGIIDTLFSNTGDVKVLIDNNGLVHAWFSAMRFYCDSVNGLQQLPWTDGLEYWNENLGTNGYVEIAATQDFDGDGILNYPVDTFTNCTRQMPWGVYNGGMTIMPSAGIDAAGKIYMAYSALDELADTTYFHEMHRHIYMMTLSPPYNPADWSYPYDIIPSLADGGNGEMQEGAFACVGRHVDNTHAYVLYQRDDAPGHTLSPSGTCDHTFLGISDIILTKVNTATVGITTYNQNELFVSQNYPNPAFGITRINIALKMSADIRFEVFDIIGKNIYSEMRKQLQSGNHTISFNTADLEPGIYNYTVIAGGQRVSRQMIIQK